MAQTLLMIGTAKGLFLFSSQDRRSWEASGPHFPETPVYTAVYDRRTGTLLTGVNSEFYGPSIRRSQDLGETWDTGGSGLQYRADDPEKVSRVWSILPAGSDEPGVIYAGVEASGLFRSDDGGDSWSEIASLRQHPTHELWGPGNGGKCLHTIAIDPYAKDHLYIACSAGGLYRSDNGGDSWSPRNEGIRAPFMPEGQQYPVAGQCVHKFALSPAQRGRVWLQNHGGVYRSDDGGDTWTYVGGGLQADFGFAIATDPKDQDTAFVIPLQRDLQRWAPEARLAVHVTHDAGETWRPLHKGLPDGAYVGVLRDAFRADEADPLGLYFGTTSGSVFASADTGAQWMEVARHLPRIFSVTVAEIPA